MRAYYFDNLPGDQRLQHDSGRPTDSNHLSQLGVLYWTIPPDTPGGWEPAIDTIAVKQGYRNRDTINVTKEGLGDLYETKLKSFFEECVVLSSVVYNDWTKVDRHMHEDDEIRYILSGSGFFDVRGLWMFSALFSFKPLMNANAQIIPRTSGSAFTLFRVIFWSFLLASTTASHLTNQIKSRHFAYLRSVLIFNASLSRVLDLSTYFRRNQSGHLMIAVRRPTPTPTVCSTSTRSRTPL
jgi:ARD/ARD' family